MVVAVVGGLIFGSILLQFNGTQWSGVIWFAVTVLAFAALGWVEDSKGLTIGVRLGAQALISGAAASSTLPIGGLPLGLAVLAAVGGVFYVNAANFMDGINGISGMHGIVIGVSFAAIGLVQGSDALVVAGLVVAAAFMSFLPWNVPRARMFLGDVGSYALGGAAWGLCVGATAVGTPPLIAVAPLLIYMADVLSTLMKRAWRRAPLHHAHREHIYQRLQQISASHGFATALATVATAACAALGLWSLQSSEVALWAIPLVALVVLMYLATPRLLTRMSVARTQVDA